MEIKKVRKTRLKVFSSYRGEVLYSLFATFYFRRILSVTTYINPLLKSYEDLTGPCQNQYTIEADILTWNAIGIQTENVF